jgi:hypothetical protein
VAEQEEAAGPLGESVQVEAGPKASPGAEEERETVPAGLDFTPAASTSVTVTDTTPSCPGSRRPGETETVVAVARVRT